MLWYYSNHGFTIETVVVPRKSFWNSKKICNMTLGVLCSNSTHVFTLITLLLSGKSLWNSLDMRSVTLEVIYTNSTHEVTLVTRVHPVNPLAK